MQTVFIGDVIFTERSIEPVPSDIAKNEALMELPTCPLCLEKLDSSATGLSSASTILHEAFLAEPSLKRSKWPHLLDECKVCKVQAQLQEETKIQDFQGEERKDALDIKCE